MPRRTSPTPLPGADVRVADEPGPGPVLRAVQGLLLGAAAGAIAAALTPRPERARRTYAASHESGPPAGAQGR